MKRSLCRVAMLGGCGLAFAARAIGAPGPFGAEVQYLYAYWYKLGSLYSYAERSVEPTLFGAVLRLPLQSKVNIDVGAGAYHFEDFTD